MSDERDEVKAPPVAPEADAPAVPADADAEPPIAEIPRWIPALIGVTLVALAALAIYTGVRYRNANPLAKIASHTPRPVASSQAPPGEPQPGASLILPGDSENVPEANAPVSGPSRAVITGNAGGVSAVVRMWARRGMIIRVKPDDAMIYVNELPIGPASQFDTPDETYDFPAEGSYSVKVSAPGFIDRTFIVTSGETAKDEVALIDVKLEPEKK